MKERYSEVIRSYSDEVDGLYRFYKDLELKGNLDEKMKQQQVHVVELGTILFRWKGAIYNENWNEIPTIEQDFLKSVESLEEAEGGFSALYGLDREKAIQKNEWLLAHDLPYVDDEFPLAPALVLKQSADFLLSVGAILFLSAVLRQCDDSRKGAADLADIENAADSEKAADFNEVCGDALRHARVSPPGRLYRFAHSLPIRRAGLAF